MSGEEQVDLSHFVVALLEYTGRQIEMATQDLTEEQLYIRPTEDANSIAWLAWHLSRWHDHVSAGICGEPEVWVSGGWAERFGLPQAATGWGDSPAEVAAFHIDRVLLFGYATAAQQATAGRVAGFTAEQLAQPVRTLSGEMRPAWRSLVGMCGDFLQHTGQIQYLRGLMSGYGWRGRTGAP